MLPDLVRKRHYSAKADRNVSRNIKPYNISADDWTNSDKYEYYEVRARNWRKFLPLYIYTLICIEFSFSENFRLSCNDRKAERRKNFLTVNELPLGRRGNVLERDEKGFFGRSSRRLFNFVPLIIAIDKLKKRVYEIYRFNIIEHHRCFHIKMGFFPSKNEITYSAPV